jgi:hypothetical protein
MWGVNLACFQSVPHRPLLAPIYRWLGLKDREGSDTDYNIDIRHGLIFWLALQLGLAGLRGTQLTGSIIYTIVNSPRDSTRIADSGWISDLQIFDLINIWLLHIFKSSTWSFDLSLYYNVSQGVLMNKWQLWQIKRPVNYRNRYLSPTSNSIPLDLNSGNRSNPFFCRI